MHSYLGITTLHLHLHSSLTHHPPTHTNSPCYLPAHSDLQAPGFQRGKHLPAVTKCGIRRNLLRRITFKGLQTQVQAGPDQARQQSKPTATCFLWNIQSFVSLLEQLPVVMCQSKQAPARSSTTGPTEPDLADSSITGPAGYHAQSPQSQQ